MTWSFLATSHGKGSVDAVGGVVKNVVHRRVIAQDLIVNNAHDFCSLAIKHVDNNKIKVIYVEADEMNTSRLMLEERLKSSPPIPNIQKLHHFEYHPPQLRCWPSSNREEAYMSVVNYSSTAVAALKRGRGRPRKLFSNDTNVATSLPKKRGRPAKHHEIENHEFYSFQVFNYSVQFISALSTSDSSCYTYRKNKIKTDQYFM